MKLPEPTTRVPREKPLPDKEKAMTRCAPAACRRRRRGARGARFGSWSHSFLPSKPTPSCLLSKPLCRWEKFAKEKGIKKRKRGKMVWDDTQQEWRRARRPHPLGGLCARRRSPSPSTALLPLLALHHHAQGPSRLQPRRRPQRHPRHRRQALGADGRRGPVHAAEAGEEAARRGAGGAAGQEPPGARRLRARPAGSRAGRSGGACLPSSPGGGARSHRGLSYPDESPPALRSHRTP